MEVIASRGDVGSQSRWGLVSSHSLNFTFYHSHEKKNVEKFTVKLVNLISKATGLPFSGKCKFQ
jgi:hypothetical protein